MVPMEIVDRVFKVAKDDSEGTGFALDVDGKQYLITAKHVIDDRNPCYIDIFHDNSWKKVWAEPIGISPVDISVFRLSTLIADPRMVMDVVLGGFYMAQEVFFAGFPLGLSTPGVNSPFPVPLIKRAIISGSADGGNLTPFYLDGHVNPGFSGGPVYLKILGQQKFSIAMVISSFHGTQEPVINNHGIETDKHVIMNSGIIFALSINNVLDLISTNPEGYPLPDLT